MALAVAPEVGAELALERERLVETAKSYKAKSRADATRRAYAWQFRRFESWCAKFGLASLPATGGSVAVYIAACAKDDGLKPATISQAMSAIASKHLEAGFASPCSHPDVADVWGGISREHLGDAQAHKDPLGLDSLRKLLEAAPDGPLGTRDRALLAIGFAGGFRRSELVAVNVSDLNFVRQGVEVHVRRSKTDQTGRGLVKMIALGNDEASCPVRLLKLWLDASETKAGPVFRPVDRHGNIGTKALTGHAVAQIVKRAALRADLDPENLSGHSLRAGFVTEAKERGADDAAIMDQTGHKSIEMVHRYTHRIDKWKNPASAKLGL